MRIPKVDVDLRPFYKGEERGHHDKTLIVLHETVSYNRLGVGDILGPAAFLDKAGYEIHGIIDAEAHSAWCYDPTAIYDHAASGSGGVNTRSIGFELVSEIPLLKPSPLRLKTWLQRRKQLDKIAEWCAYLSTVTDVPLEYSDASDPGITSHWDVSKTYHVSGGHWDCWPRHKGGHFPILYVVQKARKILKAQKGI